MPAGLTQAEVLGVPAWAMTGILLPLLTGSLLFSPLYFPRQVFFFTTDLSDSISSTLKSVLSLLNCRLCSSASSLRDLMFTVKQNIAWYFHIDKFLSLTSIGLVLRVPRWPLLPGLLRRKTLILLSWILPMFGQKSVNMKCSTER